MQDASSEQQTKQKYKPNHQKTGLKPDSALPIRGKTNKQKLSINLTLYKAYTNHWTNLRRAETKRNKEFRIMIVKMIKNLEIKMDKMQESINKDLEELKNKHTEISNTITEIKNTLEGINSRISEAEE